MSAHHSRQRMDVSRAAAAGLGRVDMAGTTILCDLEERARSLRDSLRRIGSSTSTSTGTGTIRAHTQPSLPICTSLAQDSDREHICNDMRNILNDQKFLVHPHKIRKAHHNIDNTLKTLETVLEHFDLYSKVHFKVPDDPLTDFDGYMKTVDELQKAIIFFTNKSWLKGSRETLHNAEASLRKAMQKLEKLFKYTLTINSTIIEPTNLVKLLSNISSQSNNMVRTNPDGSCKPVDDGFEGYLEIPHANWKIEIPVLLSPGCLFCLHEIARRMIAAGHAQDCLNAYREIRLPILEDMLQKLGVEIIGTKDSQGTSFERIEAKVGEWPKHLHVYVHFLLSGERKLCNKIFYKLGQYKEKCFVDTTKNIIAALLNSADKFMDSKKHFDDLLPILSMYKAMHDTLPQINGMFQASEGAIVLRRFKDTLFRLGETASDTLNKFEQTIERDASSKISMQDGTVHPLSIHVLNQVKIICDHHDILEHIISKDANKHKSSITVRKSLSQILTTLLCILYGKSKNYKDSALAQVFLMNNIQCMILTVQRCYGKFLLGEDWLQEHQSLLHIHGTNYQHASWEKALQCLSLEGLLSDGGHETGNLILRSLLKGRFKAFNHIVKEVHQCQTRWIIPDADLRKALQNAVMESIVPAYALFLKRFSEIMQKTKYPNRKYIKYTVEELQILLAELFEGKPV